MNLDYLMVIELAMITIALGFLLQSQSNTMIANIVSAIVILVGAICLILIFSNWSQGKMPQQREVWQRGIDHKIIQISEIPSDSVIFYYN